MSTGPDARSLIMEGLRLVERLSGERIDWKEFNRKRRHVKLSKAQKKAILLRAAKDIHSGAEQLSCRAISNNDDAGIWSPLRQAYGSFYGKDSYDLWWELMMYNKEFTKNWRVLLLLLFREAVE